MLLGAPLEAQTAPRPEQQWRTLKTAHFSFHYPRDFEQWTRAVAEHMEGVDSAVAQLVGFTPSTRIQVVVDDPLNEPNGSALPFLRSPVLNFWPVPPSPREQIGNYRSWGEMLSVHEFAHLAHLTRPSRNPLNALIWNLAPVDLGPIAAKAPRWVIEGYATYVEGKITGSGRPNGAWRAAILRQWALEGQLPTYDQMSNWSAYAGGSFAYLAGSAYLEWLADGWGGDSALVHLWRRATARRDRSFDEAFIGVFGDSPQALYGRFTVALTADAVAARRSADLADGTMVQHLVWTTGDPAFSRDGSRVALVLRTGSTPGRTVIWNSSPATQDTMQEQVLRQTLRRDPEDVAPVHVYPPTRRPVATLNAVAGRTYENPHFMPDGRLLVDRATRQPEGNLRPDLYIWNPTTSVVHRLTHNAGVADADPSPDGTTAIGTRCTTGSCDVVTVNLITGAVSAVLAGTPTRSYYRPRYAPDGRHFAVSALIHGRWQLLLMNTDGDSSAALLLDQSGNRYDAEFTPSGDTLIFVSDASGIPNLEGLSLKTGHTFYLTSVSGAAVGPAINPATGAIWFLNLHARGYDVRALNNPTPIPPPMDIAGAFGMAAPPRVQQQPAIPTNVVRGPFAYELGPRHTRWLPGESWNADGFSTAAYLTNTDVIGRLNTAVGATYGARPQWNGGIAALDWRGNQLEFDASAHTAQREPSRGSASGTASALDAARHGGLAAMAYERYGDLWQWRTRTGLGYERLSLIETVRPLSRLVAFAEWTGSVEQSSGTRSLAEQVAVHFDAGKTGSDDVRRSVARASVNASGFTPIPVAASFIWGRMYGSTLAFEQFAAGGLPSTIVDSSLTAARLAVPALPNGAVLPAGPGSGSTVYDLRLSAPIGWVAPYYQAVRIAGTGAVAPWHRVAGIELRFSNTGIPQAYLPGFSVIAGIARSLNRPRTGTAVYSEVRIIP